MPGGTTTTTDANGNYILTVSGASLGTITAQTDDGFSNVASAYFTPPTPSLSLTLTPVTADTFTLSGDLTGEPNVAYQTIDFNGPYSGSTTTDANGHYSITVEASVAGQIAAQSDDGFSNVAVQDFTPCRATLTA